MYTEFFGLQELPFGLTPDTQFFLNTKGHREAFNMLQVALASGEGFIKVVGEVGTGKTMLCRQLLNSLGDEYYSAYIPNPFLSPGALYKAVAEELDVTIRSRDGINDLQKAINDRLIELVADNKKVVLIIDEAQAMPPKTMEALRLISNLETEKSKLIHIVLFGQPELDRMLDHESLRQVRQRISFCYRLPSLDDDGVRAYVQHRITTAGYNGESLFNRKALQLLSKTTGGVPRLINIVSHKALMCAYGKGDRQIDRKHVVAAINDTEGVAAPSAVVTWLMGLLVVAAAGTAVVLLALPGGLL